MKKILSMLFMVLLLSNCAVMAVGSIGKGAYNVATDKRDLGEQGNDFNTMMAVKSALLDKSLANFTKIKVYCFNKIVYLIGEEDDATALDAEATASTVDGVSEIRTKWFAVGTSSTISDIGIKAKVATNLLFASKVASNQLSVEVYGGNVVLLGILSSHPEIERAIRETENTKDVKEVFSFLTTIDD